MIARLPAAKLIGPTAVAETSASLTFVSERIAVPFVAFGAMVKGIETKTPLVNRAFASE